VNTFSGTLVESATDLSVPTNAGTDPLQLDRTYVSMFADSTSFPVTALGPGWRHRYGAALTLANQPGGEASTVIYEAATGNRMRFFAESSTDPVLDPAPGMHATMLHWTDGYTMTLRDQSQELFDTQGRLTALMTPAGQRQTLTYYDAPSAVWDGQLHTVEDVTTGRTLTFTYTAVNQQPHLQHVTDSSNRQITYTYTTTGQLATVSDLRGGVTTYTYTGTPARLATITDPVGTLLVTHSYDSQGRVNQQIDSLGRTTTYDYVTTNGAVSTTITTALSGGPSVSMVDQYRADGTLEYRAADGKVMAYQTYGAGLTPTTNVDGNGQATQIDTRTDGLPRHVLDAAGGSTSITYTANAQPQTLIATSGMTTTWSYDAAGNPTTIGNQGRDGLQQSTVLTYTVANQIEQQRGPDGLLTRVAYTSDGQVISQTVGYGTALAQTTGYGYDALGRVVTTTVGLHTPLARQDVIVYNADSSVSQSIQNYQDGTFDAASPDQDVITSYGYDLLGRPIWVRNPLGQYAVTRYNASGQVVATARNVTSPLSFDSQGQPIIPAFSTAQPDRNVATLYGYDALGRTALVTETASSPARSICPH